MSRTFLQTLGVVVGAGYAAGAAASFSMGAISASLLSEEGKMLAGIAAGWVQALGSLLAIYAAWKIARRQDEARETQEANDRARRAADADALGLALAVSIGPATGRLARQMLEIDLKLEPPAPDEPPNWPDWQGAVLPPSVFDEFSIEVPADLRREVGRLHLIGDGAGLQLLSGVAAVDSYIDALDRCRAEPHSDQFQVLRPRASTANREMQFGLVALVGYERRIRDERGAHDFNPPAGSGSTPEPAPPALGPSAGQSSP